jgi:hypothetical protein
MAGGQSVTTVSAQDLTTYAMGQSAWAECVFIQHAEMGPANSKEMDS